MKKSALKADHQSRVPQIYQKLRGVFPRWQLSKVCQSTIDDWQKSVNPLVRKRLRRAEEFTENILGHCLSQVNENKEQLIFKTWQATIFILSILSLFSGFSLKCLCFDRCQKSLGEIPNECRELLERISRQRQESFRFILQSFITCHQLVSTMIFLLILS